MLKLLPGMSVWAPQHALTEDLSKQGNRDFNAFGLALWLGESKDEKFGLHLGT